MLGPGAHAQSLPPVLDSQTVAHPAGGSIHGTVTDPTEAVVMGAVITLKSDVLKTQRTLVSDGTGNFNFTGLQPGTYAVTVTADGFTDWTGARIALAQGEYYAMPDITLRVATAMTSVHAVYSQYDLAEEQMHVEEKQRVLGVFPNFYTTYDWNAPSLTAGQKFRLAWRTSIDPVTFLGSGAIAGIQQWQNDFSGYGQGSEGYAKRFGASYADGFVGVMIGGAILPSVLHQDPRYFYKGTGSIRSRALYAISTVVICKGDNGRWEPNYSNVLGTMASAGISNIYYPASDRNGAGVTVDNALIGLAAGAAGALLQEFVIPKLHRGGKPSRSAQPLPGAAP
jgi:hypothetical protein